jgi:tRNA1Val (adenine37-N6)-methyltransferase
MGRSGRRKVVFKQFEVHDSNCAMKVGTDALLLGSWADVQESERIVDAGTGSGILALMACQRAPTASVLAVELEPQAAAEARANVERGPWPDRITIAESSIQEIAREAQWQRGFDCFVVNPPFFHGKPKSPDSARNLARHDDALPLSELIASAAALLAVGGALQLIWPWDRWHELVAEAQSANFTICRMAKVRGRSDGEVSRVLSHWRFQQNSNASVTEEEIAIEQSNRKDGIPMLSERYKDLLDPYVLSWPEGQ